MPVTICVVIPAYNAGSTIARALDSVLAQTRPADEIVVVDDASIDETADLARSYDGVTVITLDRRHGASGARNVGIRAAKGEWIAFLDADDAWLPTKLEKQIPAILSDPQISLVFCASDEFAADGEPLGDTYRGCAVTSGEKAWKALLAANFVATPTVVAPRRLLLDLGGFDETLKIAEDQDMWIRLSLAGQFAYVPESLVHVHVRRRSLSTWAFDDQQAYTLPMIERHLAKLRDRLTPEETRNIMGTRIGGIGRIACGHGDLRHGLPMVLRAALLGHQPLRNLALLVKAPLSTLRRVLRRRGRNAA